MRIFNLFFIFSIFMINLISCTDDIDIHIVDPPRGSFLKGGENVNVLIKTNIGPIYLNGEQISQGNAAAVSLKPVDGLGFIKAEKQGDPLFAVRSYLQGNFRKRDDYNSHTVKTKLGIKILNNAQVSFATLTEKMMEGEELVDYVENPLIVETEIAFIPVTITVNVDSVVVPKIDVTLYFVGDTLFFYSKLHNVDIKYSAVASGIDSSGTAFYDWMEVRGEVVLTENDSDLINMTATASEPIISDDGGLPQEAFSPVVDALNEEVLDAIAKTTRNSSRVVFNTLMNTLVPQVVLNFEHAITQDTKVEELNVADENISLSYKTKIEAEVPLLSPPNGGILERTHNDNKKIDNMSITFGSALVNQIAFSVWDAGNISDIIYTKDQLLELGMANMGGNYSRLKTSEIDSLLPPILEWDESGPWLVLGGLAITMVMDGMDDTHAYTASKVPVMFEKVDNSMVLKRDESRDLVFMDVSFDRMSDFIDHDKVIELLKTAVPGVVRDLFSTFPIIEMSSVELAKLNGDPGPNILTILDSIEVENNFWRMNLSFKELNPEK